MLNISNVAHSILTEETDNYNSNNNNNNCLFFNDFLFHNDDNISNGSLHYAVYDTALFDVLKVDPEDFAVSAFVQAYNTFLFSCLIDRRLIEQTLEHRYNP
jgi:hypothetical protein